MASEKPTIAQDKPRLLWANAYFLLDTSSGASISARQMLLELQACGYEVAIIGATHVDAPQGMKCLEPHCNDVERNRGKFVNIKDESLVHQVLCTHANMRGQMTSDEEAIWYSYYTRALDTFKPDIVWYYGGQTLDLLIADEARMRGILTAALLVNGNYQGTRWCRDVDLILTDSEATAELYRQNHKLNPVAVGTFINPATVVAQEHQRKNLLFINPSWQKGVGIVAMLALRLSEQRPDITIEVVESRGDWPSALRLVSKAFGQEVCELPNVVLTPNTHDMRAIYAKARLLLAPSLWWESAGRVLVEALLNGIPVISTNRGGMPEVLKNAGIYMNLPDTCHEAPYTTLPLMKDLQPIVDYIIELYDNEEKYQSWVKRALNVGQTQHNIVHNTSRLMQAFNPLLEASKRRFETPEQLR